VSARVCLVLADLVDLRLQVGDHLGGHVGSQDGGQVDALVAGQVLERGQLDALLHVLDLGVLGDQEGVLRLSDRLVGELRSLALRHRARHGHQAEQGNHTLHLQLKKKY
jgi:hypothetical protein